MSQQRSSDGRVECGSAPARGMATKGPIGLATPTLGRPVHERLISAAASRRPMGSSTCAVARSDDTRRGPGGKGRLSIAGGSVLPDDRRGEAPRVPAERVANGLFEQADAQTPRSKSVLRRGDHSSSRCSSATLLPVHEPHRALRPGGRHR